MVRAKRHITALGEMDYKHGSSILLTRFRKDRKRTDLFGRSRMANLVVCLGRDRNECDYHLHREEHYRFHQDIQVLLDRSIELGRSVATSRFAGRDTSCDVAILVLFV